MRLLSGIGAGGVWVHALSFGHDALRDKKLSQVTFENCYFSNSSLDLTEVVNCTFIDCKFMQLRISDSTRLHEVVFQECTVDALALISRNRDIWTPGEIRQILEQAGVTYKQPDLPADAPLPAREPDVEIIDLEKLIHYFLKSTTLSDNMIRRKLSARGQVFIDDILPKLLRHNVMVEVDNRGGGGQRRFRIGATLQAINEAVVAANGDFNAFLARFS